MFTALLIIIYIAFISLGLPDSLMGSAWPKIYLDLQVPISSAGIYAMIVAAGTVVSSLLSDRMIQRFGTGRIVTVSVSMTALALLGINFAPSFVWICLLGVPLGLGAGAVDAALNNFVALHYKARHMNWLHSFWGIGATVGPLIMSLYLGLQNGWRYGYATIATLQLILVIILLASQSLWRKVEGTVRTAEEKRPPVKISTLLNLRGAKPTLIAFFTYIAVEGTTGLWGSSYLVQQHGIDAQQAAQWISFFYLGITIGRLITGFLSHYLNNPQLIRMGQLICLGGIFCLLLPFSIYWQLIGLVLIGLGCAPIYPAMLHETPNRFGKDLSQGIMGIQMATAYTAFIVMPPLFGFLARQLSFALLPFYLLALLILMFLTSEIVTKTVLAKAEPQIT